MAGYRYLYEWDERYEGRMRRLKAQEEAAKTLKEKEKAEKSAPSKSPSMMIVVPGGGSPAAVHPVPPVSL